MSLKETVKSLIDESGMSVRQFEQLMGFGNGYISKMDKSHPSAKYLRMIADYFQVSTDYLLSDGTMIETKNRAVMIPVLGYVAAGLPIYPKELKTRP